jgi:serine/threonine-protein kinase
VDTRPHSDALVGAVLEGRYRVDTVIATGGTSTVYRGLDIRLDRPVALKVMDARYANDQDFLTRFQREARAVARLKHHALVAVYDQGFDKSTEHGHPFLVMELIEGGTLRELLHERGPMPPHAVAAVLAPILSGLAVAHRAGLVHRDIKPENVLISDEGDVKIADFGLVRALAEAKITSTSVILGTAAYLSPEQVGSGDVGPRSDVYSVGILAYELLTGATPFSGDNALAVAYARMDNDVPPPSAAIAGVPRQFDDLVLSATARIAADRYADAAVMGLELDGIADELGLPDFRVPAPRNSAQHQSATAFLARVPGDAPAEPTQRSTAVQAPAPAPRHTMELARDPDDWNQSAPSRFAGVDMDEFEWARQRARRAQLFWVIAVLTLTGLVAVGAWSLGSHLNGLL